MCAHAWKPIKKDTSNARARDKRRSNLIVAVTRNTVVVIIGLRIFVFLLFFIFERLPIDF